MTVKLRGITWNHSRGYVPMIASAQRFVEKHPEVEIVWTKRSLQEFADSPLNELVEQYDLLVIDHPWTGFVAKNKALLPLEEYLSPDFLQDQAANSVGRSHESYCFDGHQMALAIDAAAPVASYRPDLLAEQSLSLPQTWDELLGLARKGLVAFPGIPIDSLMNFYMLCATQGEEPFGDGVQVVSREMGVQSLEQLRELAGLCSEAILSWNPIGVYEAMTTGRDIAYCPFAYGYSNYSRPGYSPALVRFTDMVSIGRYGKCRSTLGGTGLAISAKCQTLQPALDYAAFVAGQECQRTMYFETGGQPGHRAAWTDEEVNRRSSDFFRETLPALDRAFVRPRYDGYMHFQDYGGTYIRDYLIGGGNPLTFWNS